MKDTRISETIRYIGADDKTLDLFEGQYIIPNGISYNSYVIIDEKIAVMDTVDKRAKEQWLGNLEQELRGRQPDYLVISHMEPDHAANIEVFAEKYPDAKLVVNAKMLPMMKQFFAVDLAEKTIVVAEGETLSLGSHTLTFIMAPMVHWPEVMVAYEATEKVLFSADAFGKFGALDADEDWACEARRYYFNIVGKYGVQVRALMKKVSELDVQVICPLHGPILKENLPYYLEKYDIWSSYRPEDEGIFIAYGSMHGNTAYAAEQMAELLRAKGAKKVSVADLARDDMAEAVEDAFRYDTLIVAGTTYDGGLFPCVEDFLLHLKAKNYQNRKIAFIENGTWAPMAAKKMKEIAETYKNCELIEPVVTIRSAVKPETEAVMEQLADAVLGK